MTAGYLGADMFIMRRVDNREAAHVGGPAMNAYNRIHVGRRIQVEWGIGGLKMKWRVLQNRFKVRRVKFFIIFQACCILTNFIHRRRKNMAIVEVGEAHGGAWAEEVSDIEDN